MSPRTALAIAAISLTSLLLSNAGCASRSKQPVEGLGGGAASPEDVSTFVLKSLKGTRDGETLHVQATFGDNSSRSLLVDLHFDVKPPARLTSGTWKGLSQAGSVEERAITFLGGQSSAPSIGGRFDLVGPDNRPAYRITIPLQELKQPL